MDLYGLIGFPLGHSFSRKFFNETFFPENGIDAVYENFEIENAEELLNIVRKNPNLKGLNCTIPHKQAIIPLLDSISEEAKEIGAVNVIQIRNGKLRGFNSDIIGFTQSIKPLLKPHHQEALILGTGGASKAIRVGLEKLGIETMYVSRTAQNGRLTYEDITPKIVHEYEIIVNCSPLGMHPNVKTFPALPYHAMSERNLLYDLVYNPEETEFMRRGKEHGAVVKSGLEMLHLQALASWDFWNEE